MRADHDRARLASGHVVARDENRMMVQVHLPAHRITTQWLRVVVPLSVGTKSFRLPRIDTPVVCLLDDSLNTGYVQGAVYTDAHEPPLNGEKPNAIHFTADDGTVIEHDPDKKATLVDVPAGGSITLRVGASEFLITDPLVRLTTPKFEGVKA